MQAGMVLHLFLVNELFDIFINNNIIIDKNVTCIVTKNIIIYNNEV